VVAVCARFIRDRIIKLNEDTLRYKSRNGNLANSGIDFKWRNPRELHAIDPSRTRFQYISTYISRKSTVPPCHPASVPQSLMISKLLTYEILFNAIPCSLSSKNKPKQMLCVWHSAPRHSLFKGFADTLSCIASNHLRYNQPASLLE
jgi:hypothetical protein